MEMQNKSRTVRPDGEAIRRLRLEKGWRVEDLAKHAKCSVKTVENVERGANVYLFTLAKLAKELDVDYAELVAGGKPPPEPTRPDRRVQVQIVLSIPFEEFDESEQLSGFIEFLKQFTTGGGKINVLGAAPTNSTIITLDMTVPDMLALFAAYSSGKLAESQCVELRLKYSPPDAIPNLAQKTPMIEGTEKDFTRPSSEAQRPKGQEDKPDTET